MFNFLENDKKLDTPLSAIRNTLSKYADVDVAEIFPDFRQDKVLRFSRLFGPGKFSSLPQIWRSVRRKAKKKRKDRDRGNTSESTSDSDEPRKCNGFNLRYGPVPPKEMIMSDDEEKLLSEKTSEDKEEKSDDGNGGDQKSKAAADWRFGPAQIWYDMLDVPESGEGFNYGFKLKDKNKEAEVVPTQQTVFEPIPDDAFLMVSQLHWEDDVVWDGNAIKDKVEQKLNSKTNAAGWLPSSGSRTAGAVIGKSASGVTPTMKDSKSSLPMGKYNKSHLMKQQEETDDTWYSIFPVENGKLHSIKNSISKINIFDISEELVYHRWEDDVIWDAEAPMDRIPKPKVLTLDPNDENIILGIPDDVDPSKIQRNIGSQPKVKIPHPHVKKSKILLGKAGVINVLAEGNNCKHFFIKRFLFNFVFFRHSAAATQVARSRSIQHLKRRLLRTEDVLHDGCKAEHSWELVTAFNTSC